MKAIMCLEKVHDFYAKINVPIHSTLQGVGTRDDIDKTLKLGMNHPMGPLELGKSHEVQYYDFNCTYVLWCSGFVSNWLAYWIMDWRLFFGDLDNSIGLDTCLSIQQVLYQGTSDSKYRPSVLLERMVDAGWLGKKSGKGFYDYVAWSFLTRTHWREDFISPQL
jgi:3-hydroxybutyryl-CoA dehydrogenase